MNQSRFSHDFRCTNVRNGVKCNTLLAKLDFGVIEIKCPRCNAVQVAKIFKASALTGRPQ